MAQYVLNDERVVEIRPIRPDDAERLQQSHARLSPQSQYRRYLGTKPELTTADIRYLVEIDGADHVALVATAPVEAGPEAPIIAVARFIRLPGSADTAEFAIVVGDDYQGQGLARELMSRLAGAAARRGIRRFRASMLADNIPIRRIMENLAAGEVEVLSRGTVVELEVELAPAAGQPEPIAPTEVSVRDGRAAIIAPCPGDSRSALALA